MPEIENKPMETMDLEGVEIFAAGTWNGDTYSVDDLDSLVSAFEETKTKLRPYLKIGHGEKQTLLAEDELPAAGWINRVYRVGRKLVADVKRVPKKIYELIKAGAYGTVSSEIYTNIPIDGKTHPLALKAVSILGGATPAVHDLSSIMALYSAEQKAVAFKTDAEVRKYEVPNDLLSHPDNKPKEDVMDSEKLQKEITELKEANIKLAEENKILQEASAKMRDDIAAIKAFADETKAQNEALKQEKRVAEAEAIVEKFVQEKKILPAQKDAAKTILLEMDGTKKFKLGDKEMSISDAFLQFVSANGSVGLPTEEQSEKGTAKTEEEAQQKLYKEYELKHKVSFKDAVIAVNSGLR